jgi:hypothetical protein
MRISFSSFFLPFSFFFPSLLIALSRIGCKSLRKADFVFAINVVDSSQFIKFFFFFFYYGVTVLAVWLPSILIGLGLSLCVL